MIKGFTPRLYQETIFATASRKNTLVVLPTGLGKTNIFLMLAAHRLKQFPDSKVLFIGPTKPLIEQYLLVFRKYFEIPEENMAVFTGLVKPEKRAELWKSSQIIFSTPQGLENDIINRRINLEEVSLLGVDEAHRAVGEYSYVFVAKQYNALAKYPRIVALTASPGSDLEKILEVCRNLFVEEVELRTYDDPDVKPYIQPIDVSWVSVSLPERFIEVRRFLNDFIKSRMDSLKKWNIAVSLSKKDLLMLQARLHAEISRGDKNFRTMKAVSLLAEIIKVQHAAELLETQGVTALKKYFDKLQEEAASYKSKAAARIAADINFKSALVKANALFEQRLEHPKIDALKDLVLEEVSRSKEAKIIVFNNYRDSAVKLVSEINKIEGVKSQIFVGQLKKGDTGLSQKEQKKVLDEFREGKFNVIVATSIGEEGLDIPKVDLVIFYEPIPSAIRHIQRRGRTGRFERGKVIILTTKGTRDEAFRWVAHNKEKMMFRNLRGLRERLRLERNPDTPLKKFFSEEKIRIFADSRESSCTKRLVELGADVEVKRLEIADYVCSSRVGVEVKTVEDFVKSIIDGRLLRQMSSLKMSFERPIVILEGEEDIYSVRKMHPNAIRGMLATVVAGYGIPILSTKSSAETAAMIFALARREQKKEIVGYDLHSKKPVSLKEQQEYVVSSLPGIESTLARNLLKSFKSVKAIANSTEEDLKCVDLIGDKKAAEIRKVFDEEYKEE